MNRKRSQRPLIVAACGLALALLALVVAPPKSASSPLVGWQSTGDDALCKSLSQEALCVVWCEVGFPTNLVCCVDADKVGYNSQSDCLLRVYG